MNDPLEAFGFVSAWVVSTLFIYRGYHFGLYFNFWDCWLGANQPNNEAKFKAITE